MRLTHRLANQFTHRPAYPRGARGVRLYRWRWWVGVVIVLALLTAAAWALREHRRAKQDQPASTTQPAPAEPNSRT
jgi:heme/copper-type cytochrome/quinol oxidase subunit 2